MSRDREILRAAAKLFYERGFHAVGVDEIGEAVGITGPALYRHFGGKDEILGQLFDEVLDDLFTRIGPPQEDPFAELQHLVRVFAERAVADPILAGVHAREGRALVDPYRRRIRRREAVLVGRWTDCLARCYPDRPFEELLSATHAALGLLHSVSHWPKEALRATRQVELLCTITLGGLSALDGGGTFSLTTDRGPGADQARQRLGPAVGHAAPMGDGGCEPRAVQGTAGAVALPSEDSRSESP